MRRLGLDHSRIRRALFGLVASAAMALGSLVVLPAGTAAAANPCGPPVVSVIACENTQTGDPASDWQISGSGSSTIQGFATSISVSPGETVQFKVNTPSKNYHFDILRLGYYQGNGARKLASGLKPSVALPQTQPACLNDPNPTGLIDCGNWGVSASWTVPTTAVSGVYIAHLVRDDVTGAASHIVFIVRNDTSHSDVLFQTDDETWQAYNTYGGNSLYSCTVNCPPGTPHAYQGAAKVSYNRPFHSADDDQGHSWLMYAEYPMIRFMEANGYDVSYTTGIDVGTAAGGALLTNHKTFMTAGHDEYWSGTQRTNVEAARDAGVNLAFFTGNETFWKTRTEPSIDGTATAERTLVCYKETHYDGVVDPKDPPTWTGTWQDPRFSPPGDGGRPQNALTGQLFVVNSGTTDIKVPAAYAKLRFWRNTPVASLTGSQSVTLGAGDGTLGYEWDAEPDNGFRPAGEFDLSSTTSTSAEVFTDYGSTTQTGSTATHHLSLYRAPSGALVFGAGTVQWSFGLDSAGGTPDPTMQQATVNLFADMGAQPYAPISGVTRATASADTAAPTSTITSPASAANLGDGTKVTVSGTASDTGGGVVAGVEVSTDGGSTWHPATGTTSWTYSWTVHGSPTATIKTRAVDDSGNMETPSAGVTVDVGCTCSIWGTSSAPTKSDSGTATAVEVGVKFKSDVSGKVTGIRFYKASTNTGTHVGNLWTASGTKIASATFSGESASGWQQVSFASPVPINAGTVYVASYFAPSGHTAQDDSYFYPNPSPLPQTYSTVDSPPLHALRNVNGTVNGLFQNSSTSTFPMGNTNARNYWVDVMFTQNTGPATVPGVASSVTATPGHSSAVVSWTAPSDGGSLITSYMVTPYAGSTALAPTTVSGSPPATSATVTGLTNGTAYTFTVATTNAVGTGAASAASNATTPSSLSCSACTIWPASATPTRPDEGDPQSTELGVRFKADLNGVITGIRFYKSTSNTGTHIGNLWAADGTKLATGTFSGESATGWQKLTFASPVPVTAGAVYVASYFAPNGHYAGDSSYFASAGVDNVPLHALKDGVSGADGVYSYSGSSVFPVSTFNSENYWVDVSFATSPATVPDVPTGVSATTGDQSATVTWTAPADGGSPLGSYIVTPYSGTTALAPTTVTGTPPATSTTVTGLTNGTAYTFTVSAVNPVGTSASSAASTPVVPAVPTVPGSPGSVTASAGNASAQVSWTAAANNGNAVTSYTVTPYLGSIAQAAKTVAGSPPATTTTVTGLTNGSTYTFVVSATNGVGTGPASAASNPVVPSTAGCASVCSIWSATATPTTPDENDPQSTELGVKFKADANGSITGMRFYKSTANTGTHIGNLWTSTGTKLATGTFTNESASGWQRLTFATPVPITAGTVYVASYFAPVGHYAGDSGFFATAGVDNPPLHALKDGVSGGNGVYGYGSASAFPTSTYNSENYWVDVSFVSAPTAPAAPSGVTATAASGSAAVSWTAPFTGGSPITGYTVTPFSGTTALTPTVVTGNPPSTSAAVTGLTNGTAYTFKVSATNAVGTGPDSPVSNTVTPVTVSAPGTPTAVTANAGNGSATVSWTAPSSGGDGITSYTLTPYIGTTAQSPTIVAGSPPATAATVTGLTNGTIYTFTVSATNGVGTGPESAPSGAVTPATAPAAPPGVTATAGPGSAVVSWTAPSNGGSPITSYRVTPYAGSTALTATTVSGSPPSASVTVSGLTNGTAYTFTVSATNTMGTSPDSQPSPAVTPATTPEAPTAVSATAGDASATVSWTAPANGGSAITGYTVTPYAGATALAPTTVSGNPPATTATVTGLTNGTAYTFTVSATNAVGAGAASAASSAVTPVAVTAPAAPTAVTATAGSGSAVVSWTAPSNGGSAITLYTVTPYIGTTAQAP
ncbi:DUF4082 domain-containing protein, partial [Pedococcus sp.]|uniref:DUF4082 domain-containing protein n=1 Tax=Pedococcus sp. TaxID=2860345 RepID=UPI002E0EB5BD|nr:DUF4082 domain-containing protein [Pedococcus sp.]